VATGAGDGNIQGPAFHYYLCKVVITVAGGIITPATAVQSDGTPVTPVISNAGKTATYYFASEYVGANAQVMDTYGALYVGSGEVDILIIQIS